MIIEIPEAIKQAICQGGVLGLMIMLGYLVGYAKGREK